MPFDFAGQRHSAWCMPGRAPFARLPVEEGSLYPALQRMSIKGWVTAEWGQSDHNRRARYYKLTPAGRRQLTAEISEFEKVMEAIARVIQPA